MTDLSKLASVEDVVKQSSSIVREITRSHKLSGILKSIVHPTETTGTLKFPVKARWNSNAFCHESLERNTNELQQLAVDTVISKEMKASILSDVFWDKLHHLLTLLKPISEKITITEADKPQISLWPNYFQSWMTILNSYSLNKKYKRLTTFSDKKKILFEKDT